MPCCEYKWSPEGPWCDRCGEVHGNRPRPRPKMPTGKLRVAKKRPWRVEVSDGAQNPSWQRWGSYETWERANEVALTTKDRARIIHVGNIHTPGKDKEAPHV